MSEGDGEYPRKKGFWNSEEEKKNTTTFKRISFKAILEEAQNNWEVPNAMTKYDKQYFEKYVIEKELRDNITLSSTNKLATDKGYDDYFVELLEDQKKKKEIVLDDAFMELKAKVRTIIRPLTKVWYTVEKSLTESSKKFDVDEMSQYFDQIILLIGQVFNSVSYECK